MTTEVVAVRFPKKILEEIEKIVKRGYYNSRSEYIQEKIRKAVLLEIKYGNKSNSG